MCFSAGFRVPASHQLRSYMHGLFHDRLVFPCGTVKTRHAWRWAGGKRNYLSFIKTKNPERQTFGFSSGQMLRSSLILSWPLPLPLGVIFSECKDGQSPGRFQSTAGFAAGWTWNSSATEQDSIFSCRQSEGSTLARTQKRAHTRTNQFSPVCWGGFGYSIWSQRFHLSHSDSERCSPACLLPLPANSQKNPPPCLPPSLPSTHNTKSKNQPKLVSAAGTYQPEHTHVGHPWELCKVLDQREKWRGGAGQREEQGRILFLSLLLLLSALLERKRKKDYSSFSIKWKD